MSRVDARYLLTTQQMATFVAQGLLRFDELIPEELNRAIMAEFDAGLPSQAYGTPLSECYPEPSATGRMLRLPEVQGIIHSLVGPNPLFDHHAIHIRQPHEQTAQAMHGDAIIDTRVHFDIQLMYFPHDVPLEMGGTLVVPGSHFRRINEMDIARYQNFLGQMPVVCKAGTLLALHHGMWHCGRRNQTDRVRYMYKLRLNPTVRQLRLWNTSDLEESKRAVQTILGHQEPWFEDATGRLEIINRIKLWRFLTGDTTFDVSYWLTRVENKPENVLT